MRTPTDPVWSVIIMLTIGLLGTIWWIYDILKLAYQEDVHLQDQENHKDS